MWCGRDLPSYYAGGVEIRKPIGTHHILVANSAWNGCDPPPKRRHHGRRYCRGQSLFESVVLLSWKFRTTWCFCFDFCGRRGEYRLRGPPPPLVGVMVDSSVFPQVRHTTVHRYFCGDPRRPSRSSSASISCGRAHFEMSSQAVGITIASVWAFRYSSNQHSASANYSLS